MLILKIIEIMRISKENCNMYIRLVRGAYQLKK